MVRRTKRWNAVRWSEFVLLGLAVALAAVEAVRGAPLGLPPGLVAGLAITSKALRAALAAGRRIPASTMHPGSWAAALVLAALATFAPVATLGPGQEVDHVVVDAPDPGTVAAPGDPGTTPDPGLAGLDSMGDGDPVTGVAP